MVEWGCNKGEGMVNQRGDSFFTRFRSKKTTQVEAEEGSKKRQQIIHDAEAMTRLSQNSDFKRFCELLVEDRESLNRMLLNTGESAGNDELRIRLIARINQIDRSLSKPKSLIWQMENLTEVRAAIKEQSLERQALGNKTGGQDGN